MLYKLQDSPLPPLLDHSSCRIPPRGSRTEPSSSPSRAGATQLGKGTLSSLEWRMLRHCPPCCHAERLAYSGAGIVGRPLRLPVVRLIDDPPYPCAIRPTSPIGPLPHRPRAPPKSQQAPFPANRSRSPWSALPGDRPQSSRSFCRPGA